MNTRKKMIQKANQITPDITPSVIRSGSHAGVTNSTTVVRREKKGHPTTRHNPQRRNRRVVGQRAMVRGVKGMQ